VGCADASAPASELSVMRASQDEVFRSVKGRPSRKTTR
jgi:hypothetical protein